MITCVSILLAGAGCSEDENETAAVLTVERDGVNFANGTGTATLDVTTNTNDWTVTTENGQTWLTAGREGSAVKLSVAESNERTIRASYAVITAGSRTKKLVVKQLGYEADIIIDPEAPDEVPATGGTVTLSVTANVDLTVTIPVTWITSSQATRALPMTASNYTYTVEANQSDEPRSATLTFAETGGAFSKQVEIVQAACPPTIENLQAEAQQGAIKLTWASLYTSRVEVSYTIVDPLTETETPETLTVEDANQVVIDDLRARYGEIEFSLQPFNNNDENGETVKIKQTAQPAPVQIFPERTATWIQIPAADVLSRVWTDASHPSGDGAFVYLIDGIEPVQYSEDTSYGGLTGNYFHQRWSSPQPFPHYIVMDLGKKVKAINFYYLGRANTGAADPAAMDVLVSNSFTPVPKAGTSAVNPEHVISETTEAEENAQLLHAYANGDLPISSRRTGGTGGSPTKFSSEDLSLPSSEPFRYVWFKIKEAYTGSYTYVALSELKVYEVKPPHTYDPETEVETPLP